MPVIPPPTTPSPGPRTPQPGHRRAPPYGLRYTAAGLPINQGPAGITKLHSTLSRAA